MSNIIPFRPKVERGDNFEAYQKSIRDTGLAMRDLYHQAYSEEQGTWLAMIYAFRNMSQMAYLRDIDPEMWYYTTIEMDMNKGNGDMNLSFLTNRRPDLVPEFGDQDRRTFFHVSNRRESIVGVNRQSIPNDLIETVLEYANGFAYFDARSMQFAWGYIAALLEAPQSMFFLGHERSGGQFVIRMGELYENTKDIYLLHTITFDVMPLILDRVAYQWHQEQLDDETRN